MVTDRFNFWPLRRASRKGLGNRAIARNAKMEPLEPTRIQTQRDHTARVLVPLVAALVAIPTALLGGQQVTTLATAGLGAAALFAGSLLAAFGQVVAWRERMRSVPGTEGLLRRSYLDEAVGHILYSIFLAAASVPLGFLAIATANAFGQVLLGVQVALIMAIAVLLLFVLRAAYAAYVEDNDVPPQLNGFDQRDRDEVIVPRRAIGQQHHV